MSHGHHVSSKDESRGWEPRAEIHAHPMDNPRSHFSAHGVGAAFWWWLIFSGALVAGYFGYQMLNKM
jgi:hypothetical protein